MSNNDYEVTNKLAGPWITMRVLTDLLKSAHVLCNVITHGE